MEISSESLLLRLFTGIDTSKGSYCKAHGSSYRNLLWYMHQQSSGCCKYKASSRLCKHWSKVTAAGFYY